MAENTENVVEIETTATSALIEDLDVELELDAAEASFSYGEARPMP
ncbi:MULTISPECIES: hypothetical protein [unclassified Streptomyces]